MKRKCVPALLLAIAIIWTLACEKELFTTQQPPIYYDDPVEDTTPPEPPPPPPEEHLFYISHHCLGPCKNNLIRTYSVEQAAFVDSFDPGYGSSIVLAAQHDWLFVNGVSAHRIYDLKTKSVVKELPLGGKDVVSYSGKYYVRLGGTNTTIMTLPDVDTILLSTNKVFGILPAGDFDKDDKVFYWADSSGIINRFDLDSRTELAPIRFELPIQLVPSSLSENLSLLI